MSKTTVVNYIDFQIIYKCECGYSEISTLKVHKDGLLSFLSDEKFSPDEQEKLDIVFMREENGKYRYGIEYIKELDKAEDKMCLD